MALILAISCLFTVFASTTIADLTLLSDLGVDNTYTDVHSVFVNGYYVMVYVGSRGSLGFYQYNIGLYQLNGSQLTKHTAGGSRHFNIKSENSDLRLTAKPEIQSSEDFSALLDICSSTECTEFSVRKNSVTLLKSDSWCHYGILITDHLRAVAENLDYTVAVVSREMVLYAYICPPSTSNFPVQNFQLVGTDSSGPFTKLHSVEATIQTNIISIFVLQSNDDVTALCTFTQPTDKLSTSSDGTGPLGSSSKLLFAGAPKALAVTPVGTDHIAFVCSATGKISKVYIQPTGAYDISEFTIEPPINDVFSEMLLEDDKLLITTTERIILLDVKQTCEQHTDLCSCRAPKDPKCGWCVNSSKCSKYTECVGIWMKADPSSSTICWNATISPQSVARANPEPLHITVSGDMGEDRFRRQGNAYRCIFGTSNITTAASTSSVQSLTCAKPDPISIAQLPAGTVVLPVVIYHNVGEDYLPLIVRYKLVICIDITSCSECVNSHSTCTWCINNHKCTETATIADDCPDSLENEAKSPFGSDDTCPMINVESVRAPVDENYRLVLPVKNFPTLRNQKYSCKVTKGGKSEILEATLNTSTAPTTVECFPYQYGTNTSSASFLPNSFAISVLMGDGDWELAIAEGKAYNCSYQVACTKCLQYSESTSCVWCQDSNKCVYNQCSNSEEAIQKQCPSLTIQSELVEPTVIPVEGGQTLSIPGKGLNVGGIDNTRIEINGRPCKDISIRTMLTNNILSCTILPASSRGNANLTVIINGISWQETNFLKYYDPTLKALNVIGKKDQHGPLAGGTDVMISGVDLTQLRTTTFWNVEFFNPTLPTQAHQLYNCTIEGSSIRCKTPPVNAVPTYEYAVRLRFTEKMFIRNMSTDGETFEYRPNSIIESVMPESVIAWGGKGFTVFGQYLNSVSSPKARFSGANKGDSCIVMSPEHMTCRYPEFTIAGSQQIVLIMDGITTNLTTLNITVTRNPTFKNFTKGMKDISKELVLDGANIDNVDLHEIQVFVGGEPCNISKKESRTIICVPPLLTEKQRKENTDVTIRIYNETRFKPGFLNYSVIPKEGLSDTVIGGIAGGGSAAVVIMVVVAILLFKRSRYHKQRYKSMVKHVDQLECNSRHEIKQAFAELQTDMSDLMSDLNATGIPYWDYKNFTFKILFPGQTDHPSLHKLMTKRKTAVMQALDMFEHLINNKDFLVSFIHTLEKQPTFTMPDKVQLAALLMVTLQHKMDYATTVIKELLAELIDASIKKKHPKLLLRRSESVVEKMLTHWLSLCLYKYLQDHAGTPLFMLYKAIKHQIDKGPVDALSGEARYSLSQERLLRLTVDTKPVTLEVILESGERIQCKVNDCDTTTQVKEKILDVIYTNQAYSLRPTAIDYNLEWHHGMVGVPICDEDLTSQTVNGWKRLNTLAHYSIPENATMKLVPRHHAHSLHSDRSRDTDKLCDTLSSNRGTPRGTLTRNGALSTSNLQDHYVHSHISLWHLSKSGASHTLPKDKQQTMMSEIFLTRLLKTKGTLQEFIDKLFQTIFSADNLPPTIKFLFDFLDQEAQKHGITDPEVVHVWKNNSLNLRFWVNIIKNPEFVFDIHKSEIVDASLSTIAQTFIDSCAMSESDFGVDAPINKLLFARDRPKYRKMLQNMYSEIRNKPPVPESTLNAHLNELSKMYPREFYRNSALKEIYRFAQRYQSQIAQDLEDNFSKHKNPNLTTLLRDINTTLDERHTHMTDYV